GLRLFRFFLNADNSFALKHRHAEALGMRHFLQKDMRPASGALEVLAPADDIRLQNVVAQRNANRVPVSETLCEPQSVGDAAFALLIGIREMAQIEILTVAQQPQEISGAMSTGNQQNVADARIRERLDGIKHHGP